MIPISTIRESRGLHLHPQKQYQDSAPSQEVQNLLPKSSCIQFLMLQCCAAFLSVNIYQLIIPRNTPNVHLIPSRNANDQNKSFLDLPFSATQSLGKSVTPFHAVTHLPSSLTSPILGDPFLSKASSHRKVNNQGIYLRQNHHTSHSMLMEINGHYWAPMSHNGPAPKVLYQHTVAYSNYFH